MSGTITSFDAERQAITLQLKRFEDYLASSLNCSSPLSEGLKKVSEYSLLGGGKRIRPTLFLALLNAYGIDNEGCFPVAAALEYIHCYSLIHDDLPAMDNDDMRRGRPSSHKMFDEASAILAGDSLLTYAFQLIAETSSLSPEIRINLVQLLASAAGINGMAGGQFADMSFQAGSSHTIETVSEIQKMKTGKLILVAFEMGLEIVGANATQKNKWLEIGQLLGPFFQIRDDLLDAHATQEELGKKPGGDKEKNKLSYPSIIGSESSDKVLQMLFNQIQSLLNELDPPSPYISEMLQTLFITRANVHT